MIHSNLVHRGNHSKEKYLLARFQEWGKDDELNEYGQEFYREATARKNIIEQILIDRMGYYPKRVDNKLLDALESKIERNGTS